MALRLTKEPFDNPGGADVAGRARRPVRPRHAASILVWRDGQDGPELLMGRRNKALRFMPDVMVFPGGRVDPGDARAAAHGPATAGRHHRMPAGLQRQHAAVEFAAVHLLPLRRPALILEGGDVGAGAEGFLPRAADHDAAQRVVGGEFLHRLAQGDPHGKVHRIALGGAIDGDDGDLAFAGEQDQGVRHGRSLAPAGGGDQSQTGARAARMR